MERKKKNQKVLRGFRISAVCNETLKALYVAYEQSFSESDLVELGILGIANSTDKEIRKLGINFKKVAAIRQQEILRSLASYERGQTKSKHLFIVRLLKDVFLYVQLERPDKDINELLDCYIREAQFYDSPSDLLKEVETVKQLSKTNIAALRERLFKRINEVKLTMEREKEDKIVLDAKARKVRA